jgi:3-hydroxyacyl-CoA dehydrogenase
MAGDKISRVAAIGTGTIGASWTAVFLARGLTVAASDPAPGAETLLHEFVGAAGQASRDCRHYLPDRPGRR